MRLMSFAATVDALLDGTKTVTRRTGWRCLRPGDQLQAVDRLPRAGPFRRLCVIEVVRVSRERLNVITPAEVRREGLRDMTVPEFIEMFCAMSDRRVRPSDRVTRIEFKRL